MKPILFALAFLVTVMGSAQSTRVGIFDKAKDIGNLKNAGSSVYDPAAQTSELLT